MKRRAISSECGGRTARAGWMPAAAIALLAVAVRVYVVRATHATTEDFFITLRYARNLAAGQGFTYNPGEHVLGATSPLYTLLLAGFYLLGVDAAGAGKAVNILADGGVCIGLASLFARLGYPRAGQVAAILYAATSAPVNFASGGMETGLVCLAEVLALNAYAAGRQYALWTWLAALALLRIDGLALGAVLMAGWALERRPIRWQALMPGAGLVAAWSVFAWAYFGSPVPHSVTAKLVAYGHLRSAGMLPNLHEFAVQFWKGPFQQALLGCFAAGVVFVWKRLVALRAPVVWMFLYYGTMLASRVPAFGWYFVPPLPLYYGVGALGMVWMASAAWAFVRSTYRQAGRLHPRFVRAGGVTAEALLAAALVAHMPAVARSVAQAQELEDHVRRPIGEWLARNTAPSDRVLLEPLGYIGFYSGRRMIDAVGIVSPQVLRFYRAGVADPLAAMIAALRPEYVLLGSRDVERLGLLGSQKADGSLGRAYRFVRAWPQAPGEPVYFLFRRIDTGTGPGNIRQHLERPLKQHGRRTGRDRAGKLTGRKPWPGAVLPADALLAPAAAGCGPHGARLLEGLLGSEKPLLPA